MDISVLPPLLMRIPHSEEGFPKKSPTLHWSQHGETGVTRYLRCAWDNLLAITGQTLGRVTWDGAGFTYQPGAIYTAWAKFIAYELSAEGEGKSYGFIGPSGNTIIAWDEALLTVRYQIVPDTDDGLGRILIEEDIVPSAEYITMPHRKLFWENDNTDPLGRDERPGQVVHLAEWTYTIKRLPSIPAIYMTSIGNSNDAEVSSGMYGPFATETLRYNQPGVVSRVAFDGVVEFDLTLSISYRSTGWNLYPKAGTATFSPIYVAGGAQFRQFPTMDFGLLLANFI